MDMKMAVMPKRPLVTLLSTALLALPMISAPSFADEFLCDAIQVSTQELPQLDQSCPIGKGLWGKQKPKGQESQFWIQCGVYSKPLSLQKAKALYQHISTDVWLKPESKAYRCLIGPYQDFSVVKSELAKVQQLSDYKEAFVREIVKGVPAKQTKPAPKPVVKPKAKQKVAPKPVPAPVKQATTVLPPVVSTPAISNTRPVKDKIESEVAIRLTASIDGIEYQVPYIMFSDDQFYMEHDLPWNRMSYEQAYKTCYRQGMRLATPVEWQALLDSKVMEKDKWPMHLPYWGSQKAGLFFSGKVNQLKGSSLLNVMCVK
ncbi:SPOR domain-containing protein [Vibrio atypicus]|uniref:SPOR domain-containing protein n=1 Tax=Vibrio atypicus TaxID=558271 RepID=UPI0037366B60